MIFDNSVERLRIFWGPAATILVVAAVEVARLLDLTIPNPQLFTAVAVTFAAYSGGYRGGVLSAAIGVAYAFYFFATPGQYFSYTEINIKKVIVNLITLPLIAVLVSKLNRKYKQSISNEIGSFFAKANAPILSLDARGNVVIWNDYLERMTGYSRGQVLGRPIHEHPVFGAEVAGHPGFWEFGMDRWRSEFLEIPLRSKSGKSIELLASATARFDRSGRVDGVVCIGQDITERKNASRRLRESIQRYQGLVDLSPDGVMVNCCNKIVFCNRAMAQLLGADSVREVLGRSADAFNPPEDYALIQDRRARVLRGEKVGLRDTVIVRLDGTRLATERTMTAIDWEGDDAFLVLTRDISQRKNAERQFRQVVESLHDGFVLYDADDRLVMWNDRWLENHNVTADMIKVGAYFDDLLRANVARKLYPEAEGREEEFIAERLRHHRNPGAPLIRHLASGRWIIIRGARTADGGTFTINTDVTDIKNAENAAQTARLRAETADNSKSEFLANMSHEFRTPLNAIIGFASVMESESFGSLGNAKYQNYAQYIKQSGQHLLSLINDILDLSKVEAGAVELYEERVDVSAAVKAAIRLVRDRARKEAVTLTLEAPERLPTLRADARKLNQILFNLLTNAIKFTKPGGRVTLSVRCDVDDGYVFEVADTGIGIAPENIPLVLSKFGQVGSSLTRRQEGSGLGLPLTKSLAELHGGTFAVESEVHIGTTVTVRFPAERIVRTEGSTVELPMA